VKQIQPSDTVQDIVDKMATEGMVLTSTKITVPDGDEYMIVAGSGVTAEFLELVLAKLRLAIEEAGGIKVASVSYRAGQEGGS
jgi:hypothetical protein